jgi:hypothetical protein
VVRGSERVVRHSARSGHSRVGHRRPVTPIRDVRGRCNVNPLRVRLLGHAEPRTWASLIVRVRASECCACVLGKRFGWCIRARGGGTGLRTYPSLVAANNSRCMVVGWREFHNRCLVQIPPICCKSAIFERVAVEEFCHRLLARSDSGDQR